MKNFLISKENEKQKSTQTYIYFTGILIKYLKVRSYRLYNTHPFQNILKYFHRIVELVHATNN